MYGRLQHLEAAGHKDRLYGQEFTQVRQAFCRGVDAENNICASMGGGDSGVVQ